MQNVFMLVDALFNPFYILLVLVFLYFNFLGIVNLSGKTTSGAPETIASSIILTPFWLKGFATH